LNKRGKIVFEEYLVFKYSSNTLELNYSKSISISSVLEDDKIIFLVYTVS